MPADTNPPDDPGDLAVLARAAEDLIGAVDASLAAWVRRVVAQRWSEWSDRELPSDVTDRAAVVGEEARDRIVAELGALLAADVEAQRTNPLSVIRTVVGPVTDVLRAAGVPPVERDAHAERLHPEDVYDLAPASFAELGPEVGEHGIVWGAAKAHVVLRRRRPRR